MGIEALKAALVHDRIESQVSGDPKVVTTRTADILIGVQLLFVENGLASGTAHPELVDLWPFRTGPSLRLWWSLFEPAWTFRHAEFLS
jgi:hypothetical protein